MVIYGLLVEFARFRFVLVSYDNVSAINYGSSLQEMDGPPIPWRPGRIDGFAAQTTPDGRLPDASKGADHLRTIFYRMGYVSPQ